MIYWIFPFPIAKSAIFVTLTNIFICNFGAVGSDKIYISNDNLFTGYTYTDDKDVIYGEFNVSNIINILYSMVFLGKGRKLWIENIFVFYSSRFEKEHVCGKLLFRELYIQCFVLWKVFILSCFSTFIQSSFFVFIVSLQKELLIISILKMLHWTKMYNVQERKNSKLFESLAYFNKWLFIFVSQIFFCKFKHHTIDLIKIKYK